MMRRTIALIFPTVILTACAQLPQVSAVPIDKIPDFDAGSIISSKNGIIASDIAKIPGTICVPNDKGLCDADGLLAGQYLVDKATVSVKPVASTQPMYHALLDNRYNVSANIPFLSATVNDETYNELKATTVSTATIDSGAPDGGFPGLDKVKAALKSAGARPGVTFVFWISAANTISVTSSVYTKVDSTAQVSGTGFGANGKTYNYGGVEQESTWIGIVGHRVYLSGNPPATVKSQPINAFNLKMTFNDYLPIERTQIFDVDSHGLINKDSHK